MEKKFYPHPYSVVVVMVVSGMNEDTKYDEKLYISEHARTCLTSNLGFRV
jgi:hypothetical protein